MSHIGLEGLIQVPPLPIVADWTVEADKVGEDGPPPVSPTPLMAEPPASSSGLLGFMEWHVEVEIAVAKEIGIRHKPFPWRYCMADPISSSISLATWCSVIVMLLSLFADDVVPLLPPRPTFPCTQSPPPCKQQLKHACIILGDQRFG